MGEDRNVGRCWNCKYFLGIHSTYEYDGTCSDYIKLCRIVEYVNGRAVIQFANERQPQEKDGWNYDNPPCADWSKD
jgi:hypothetical protein